MEYILYLLIFLVLLVIFVICIGLALTIGAVVGIFVAYVRAAITYITSIMHEIDNKGARVFMITVSGIAVAIPVILLIFGILYMIVV